MIPQISTKGGILNGCPPLWMILTTTRQCNSCVLFTSLPPSPASRIESRSTPRRFSTVSLIKAKAMDHIAHTVGVCSVYQNGELPSPISCNLVMTSIIPLALPFPPANSFMSTWISPGHIRHRKLFAHLMHDAGVWCHACPNLQRRISGGTFQPVTTPKIPNHQQSKI